jgi:hypothetical protein
MGRRGPKKQKGKREPNGRLSRQPAIAGARHVDALDMEERAMIEVGIEARQRVFGVPARMSRDQLAGSVVGRLCLSGELSRVQYDAAQAWLECREAYLRAVSPAIGKLPGAIDPNATHGQSNYENVGASRLAVQRYHAAQGRNSGRAERTSDDGSPQRRARRHPRQGHSRRSPGGQSARGAQRAGPAFQTGWEESSVGLARIRKSRHGFDAGASRAGPPTRPSNRGGFCLAAAWKADTRKPRGLQRD